MALCVVCGLEMAPLIEEGQSSHPMCRVRIEEPGDGTQDPFSVMLKAQLTDMIKWADRESPRSKQVQIGPSEIGDPCDRRIGYRIAEVPEVNTSFDPWAAIVGTALHGWLDKAVNLWMTAHESKDWLTETALSIDQFVHGHSDLYSVEHKAVIDWKGAGPSVMKKARDHGPSDGYIIQTHIYGYGFERAGYPVKKVCLVFLPRAGRLQDMYVWSADYDRAVAEQSLKRLYSIARKVVDLDVLTNGNLWNDIPATPSNSCGFCPWYTAMNDRGEEANERGCPGR